MSSKTMEIREQTEVPTLAKMDSLIDWVVAAPVEEVCWRVTELGTMREWLKKQKEATALRIKAVRLEMIALRKVAAGGLAHKIVGVAALRNSAEWLAGLTDDEFSNVLTEMEVDKTPIAMYRKDLRERQAMSEALRDKTGDASREEEWRARWLKRANHDDANGMRRNAGEILREVIEMGEPFTVSEAAERLADSLGLDIEVRKETADGLREMIRTAIRRGDRTVRVDEWSALPVAFTVHLPSGEYVRIPASSATIQNLKYHWIEVSSRALAATQHAEELEGLLNTAIWEAMESRGLDMSEDDKDGVMDLPLLEMVDRYRGSATWRARDAEIAA